MSRILLNTSDPRFGVSIRLLVGQFCTVGSSPAADHCVRAAGIEAMHFRIGCRVNGAFLECVNDEVYVLINGIPRNRARLANGDRIKIGIVEMDVEMPDAPIKQSFSVSFEDEGSEGNQSDMSSISGVLESSEAQEQVSDLDTNGVNDSSGDKPLPPNDPEPTVDSSVPELNLIVQETEQPDKPKADEGKAVFEFDSVGIEDADFTGEDLAAIEAKDDDTLGVADDFFPPELTVRETENDAPRQEEPVDADNVSDESASEESASEESASEESASEESVSEESSVSGGTPQGGKCWRWSGSSAVTSALDILKDREGNFVWYEVSEHTELIGRSSDEIREAVSKRQDNAIFIFTDNKPDDVVRYLAAKRWSDRMRHPEALDMSISILPARHVAALFHQIDTVLLIQKNNTSLIRVDNF